jgi:predicted membrane channel-forming protein YqfA (hemolysin III family)
MPFTVFNVGSALLVLGFAFKVLQVTNRLTNIKGEEAGKKLRNIGIISVITGVLIALVVLGMPTDERNTMIVAGLSIAAIGVFTLIQYHLKPQNEKVLGWAAVGVIILGFLLCVAYKLVLYFKAS